MKFERDKVERPLLKLRKQLKGFSSSPAPEDVHALRTRSRRIEATLTALALQRDRRSRHLLKLITPVRKAAGKIRDMDVLISHTLTLAQEPDGGAILLLIEHLAKMRIRYAAKLHQVVKRRSRDLRRGLKLEAHLIRRTLKQARPELDDTTAPRILITELSHWPALEESNLHLFRIRIKELRYMLQLGTRAHEELVEKLGEVKDAIGEWHDWVELSRIAAKTLDLKAESQLLGKIEHTRTQKLEVARTAANRLRALYFAVPDGRTAIRKILPIAS